MCRNLARVVGKSVVTSYGYDAATTNIEFARAGRKGRQRQTSIRMPDALCSSRRADSGRGALISRPVRAPQ
jgi:hypothetical protein